MLVSKEGGMTEYDEHWITTYTGLRFHYLNPSQDEIVIEDIAHALSLKCRFSGHCRKFYSVGEHSIRVADLLPDELKLSGLLHDAAEAYIPDIPRPIKVTFGLKPFEDIIIGVIEKKFGVASHPLVKEYDTIMLATEARSLLHNMNGWGELPEPLFGSIQPIGSDAVETLFLLYFTKYGGIKCL